MEFLSTYIDKKIVDKDTAFLCGSLSMLDVIFSKNFDSIFSDMSISLNIKDALVDKKGILFDILNISLIIESDLDYFHNKNFIEFCLKNNIDISKFIIRLNNILIS
jgi:c-di-GMP-related signal transduction protein